MKFNSTFIVIGMTVILGACSKSTYQSSSGNQSANTANIASSDADAIHKMPVYPSSAKELKAISLSDLIFFAMPTKGSSGWRWTSLSDAPIQWTSDGYFTIPESQYTARTGIVRVRAGNTISTVLREQVNELAWTVTLSTFGNPKFGPVQVSIQPGVANTSVGEPDCLGVLFTGCTFSADQAIAAAKFHAELICENDSLSDGPTKTYKITAPGKESQLLYYGQSGGSGGEYAWLEVHPLSDQQQACHPSPGEMAAIESNPTTGQDQIAISIDQLNEDFNANELAADKKYQGKLLAVSGTIQNISKAFGQPYVSISNSGNNLKVTAYLQQQEFDKAAALVKGNLISVTCTKVYKLVSPALDDCLIQPANK